MTVNLLKHKDDLLLAYSDVLNSDQLGEWALFSYEGTSNTLKTEIKGHGGLSELRENLNSGKLMYGLIKIKDPSTSSWKLILIHWQGECVPSIRLGPFASHIHEVKKFFKGVHTTVYARNEEDVDLDSIAKSFSSANYGANIIVPRDVSEQAVTSKSVYERVDLKKDLDANDRDKFWQTTEKEEVRRKEEERQRALLQKRRLDEEQQKLREKISVESYVDSDDRKQPVVTSELMRRERLQEVHDVIAPKASLKSMWEKKTSALASDPINPLVEKHIGKKAIPSKPANQRPDGHLKSHDKITDVTPEVPDVVKESLAADINRLIVSKDEHSYPNSTIVQDPKEESLEREWETINVEDITNGHTESVVPVENKCQQNSVVAVGLRAEALWDYQAADDTEISLNPGDLITQIEQIDEGWWRGKAPDGSFGLFPANYVELLQ